MATFAVKLERLLQWLEKRQSLLTIIWIALTFLTAIYAKRAFDLSLRVAGEPQLQFRSPTIQCGVQLPPTDYLRVVGKEIPHDYVTKTCRLFLVNVAAPATDVRVYVTLSDKVGIVMRRIGVYATSVTGDVYPLSSLRWTSDVPREQTSPRNSEIVIGRMLAGEVMAIRLDVAYAPNPSSHNDGCKNSLYVNASALEIQKIGKSATAVSDLCLNQ